MAVVNFMCVSITACISLIKRCSCPEAGARLFLSIHTVTLDTEAGQLPPYTFGKQEYHPTNGKTSNFAMDIVSPTGRYHILCSEMDFCLCP